MADVGRISDGMTFARRLLEETGVGVAPGDAFGPEGADLIRICLAVAPKTAAEAARRIGVSDARLRQRIAAGTMMAIHRPHGRGWLIPAFQLEAEGEIPHLGRVLLAAGRPVSAQAMDRFFRIPREDLSGASPRDWLIAGHDPSIVERIVAGL